MLSANLIFLLVASLSQHVLALPNPESNSYVTHIVKEGETCYCIGGGNWKQYIENSDACGLNLMIGTELRVKLSVYQPNNCIKNNSSTASATETSGSISTSLNSTNIGNSSNTNITIKGCETFDINGNCVTCQKGYAFAKDTKNCLETALPSGCKEMDTNAKCTACNETFILQDGSCNKRTIVISNCAETVTDANGNTRCQVCQPLFIKDSNNNCIQGCPVGQFMIYGPLDQKPIECSDGKNGVYKIRVDDEKNWNTFLSSKSGTGWLWNSLSKDASYGDGWMFRISGDNTLTTEGRRFMSVQHDKYTSDGIFWRERFWTVKDHNEFSRRIILSTHNNGLTVVMKAADGGGCMINGAEGSLRYGYDEMECGGKGEGYNFKLVK